MLGAIQMRRLVPLLLGLSTACGLATTAGAQTQPFVPPTLGTKVFYSSGGYFEADSLNGTTVRVVNSRLAQTDLLAACYAAGRQEKYDPAALDKLWPLTPGKTVTTEITMGDRRWSLLIRVVGQQKLRTQAGTFDTWLITIDDTALTHAFRAVFQCWYAPEIGLPVKRHKEVTAGNSPPLDEEAVRVEKRDRSQVVEFHAPAPHTGFTTSNGYIRIDSADGVNLLQPYTNPDRKLYWVGGLVPYFLSSPFADLMQSEVKKLWPLKVGNSIEFQLDQPGYRPGESAYTYQYEATVERTQTVTVPAGTFSTFVVSWHHRGLGSNTFNGVQTVWWSPALGFPVKLDVQIIFGFTDWKGFELLAAQPPPS